MLPEQRKQNIVELVTERDGCSVADIAEHEDVSKATVRRDLQELTENGRLNRSHGGAMPVTTVRTEKPFRQREARNLEAKQAIAKRAIREISSNHVVFFDAGTTTMQIAKEAPADVTFLPVMNSPLLALEFGDRESDVKLTGGSLRHQTRALVGPIAESFLAKTRFDVLFLGTNGIEPGGLTTPNEDEARMKERMIERADHVVLVSDSSKFGERCFIRFGTLSDIDVLVTERHPPEPIADAVERTGATLSVVEEP